jgi:5-hydroxyisourate hydrolase
MSGISCHVLDTAAGRPAAGVGLRLERQRPDASWENLATAHTNADGRASGLEGPAGMARGLHRLSFETQAYFRRESKPVFYPEVQVLFLVESASERYHIPLLLSPFGYSTYRGS